jgi:hypothetical protein
MLLVSMNEKVGGLTYCERAYNIYLQHFGSEHPTTNQMLGHIQQIRGML